MILPIVAYGSNVLRSQCKEIDSSYSNLDQLIENMFETMYAASGVGLAAPQINKSIRLFIVDTSPFKDDESPYHVVCKNIFINPKITSITGESWSFSEGCLSIPEVREDVKRLSEITIEYFDKDFNKHTETYDGLNARVILHEYDHIEGILFTDKLSFLKKKTIKRKLSEISTGKIKVDYKMKFLKN